MLTDSSGERASAIAVPLALICCAALALAPCRAWAQPFAAGACTVSVLNQTAYVQGDGSWLVPNVPSNMGPVRARLTCVQNGQTLTGASGFFPVLPNDVSGIKPVVLGSAPATPVTVSLTAPAATFSAAGQTVQLRVVAILPDASTADVTAGSTGTVYLSTNPQVATVSADGLVTAHLSGKVLVTALHEAILSSVLMTVVLAGSTAGDGIPDDWKVAHGLDPNDPNVALEDPDNDGLSNLEEYQLGTDPHNPDTDGDGLSDGDEVHIYHTNPLLWDTDGDGISDGVEVKTGSDPLDPTSFNLALALSSISVDPSSFTIVFNTVFGDTSRQLKATGNVIDGRTIDMLRPLYRTNLTSSDLTVASFGPEAGRIYAGQSGSATVTVSNSGHSASSAVTVRTVTPTALSFLPIPGFANGVDVSGTYAYVAAGDTGLFVVDVSSLAAPFIAGSVDTPGNANFVRVTGSYAYVADGPAGLEVVDVSTPSRPVIVSHLMLGNAINLAVRPGRVYVAMDPEGLAVVDVSNPAQPQLLATLALPGRPSGVDLAGSLAVVAAGYGGVLVVDVSNPALPVLVGSVHTRGFTSEANDVVVREHLAYVVDGWLAHLGGIKVIDFSDPANPVLIDSSSDLFGLTSAALDGRLGLAADFYFVNAVPIFDVGQVPMIYRALLDFSKAPSFRDDNGTGIALQGGAVFLTASKDVLGGKGTVGDTGLHIGIYRVPEGGASSAPRVSVDDPSAGGPLLERTVATVKVEASDEVRVDSVQILMNGGVLATVYEAPFQATFTVPGTANVTFSAVATNFLGVTTTAQPVTVPVTANPPPVVSLLVPRAGQTTIAGTVLTIAAEASSRQSVGRVEFYINGTLDHTVTSAPFKYSFIVPAATGQIGVSAIAYDAFGSSQPAGPVVVTVVPDQPPTAAVLQPVDGTQVIAGSRLRFAIVAGVDDDIEVGEVLFFVDGTQIADLTQAPFAVPFTVPDAGQDLQIHVTAIDNIGLATTSPDVTVHVVPDPGTTVTGLIADGSGAPLAGAAVVVSASPGVSATTTSGSDGTFSVSGFPTIQGDLTVVASGTRAGVNLSGIAGPLTPVPGATTAVGTIVVGPPACVTGSLSFAGNACYSGPFTLPLDLLLVDSAGNTTPIGTVTPDANSNFCATVQLGLVYMLRRQGFVCEGQTAPCHTTIMLSDASASGQCGDPAPACQDLGALFMGCDFPIFF